MARESSAGGKEVTRLVPFLVIGYKCLALNTKEFGNYVNKEGRVLFDWYISKPSCIMDVSLLGNPDKVFSGIEIVGAKVVKSIRS